MRRSSDSLVLMMIVILIGLIFVGGANRVKADQPVTPTPSVLTTPTTPTTRPSPYAPNSFAPVYHTTFEMKQNEKGAPALNVISSDLPATSTLTYTIGTFRRTGSPPTKQRVDIAKPTSPITPGDFVDNWEVLVDDNFEGSFPNAAACEVGDFSNDGFERYWGQDTFHGYSSTISIWPARAGADGLDPATNNYPPNMSSWLTCGPYDFTQAQYLLAKYQH